jgi:hypothetical protein
VKYTIRIGSHPFAAAQNKAETMGERLEDLIRSYREMLVKGDTERSIAEFKRLSNRGNSRGRRFDRSDIHERP